MKRMRPILLLLLCFIWPSACSATPTDLTALPLASRNSISDGTLEGDSVAVAFSVTTPLAGLEFACNITGESPEITVQIFRADTDYDTTLSADPEREERISDLTESLLWQFSPLPAGDYIVLFSGAKDAQLIKSLLTSPVAAGKILHFRNGTVMTDGTAAVTLYCTPASDTEPGALKIFTYPVMEE